MDGTLQRRIFDVLERRPDVVGAYLFGSRAAGTATETSDVDLAVVTEPPHGLGETIALEDELERATGLRVDLVDLGRAGAFLALEAIRGERIFERDGRRLDELDLYVLRRAADLAPFERERRRMALSPEPR